VFGPAHQDIEVRCQGGICRLRGPGVLRSRDGIDEGLLGRMGADGRHEVTDDAAYFELEPPPTASAP
jgi:hypothetical protein